MLRITNPTNQALTEPDLAFDADADTRCFAERLRIAVCLDGFRGKHPTYTVQAKDPVSIHPRSPPAAD